MKSFFSLGSLSEMLGRPSVIVLVLVQFVLVVGLAAYYHGRGTSDGCLYCHSDKAMMERERCPQFYMTQAQVEKESRMPGVACVDCHLGDGATKDKETAHRGMLRPMLIGAHGEFLDRKGRLDSLMPTGTDRMYAMLPKAGGKCDSGPDPEVFTVLWHDRDRETLGYDPKIAMSTCGRKGCHPQEVKQFTGTIMGGNVRQRSMAFWTDRHGPNNCGPSFADLPPTAGAAAGFSFANYELVRSDLSCPSSYQDAKDRQLPPLEAGMTLELRKLIHFDTPLGFLTEHAQIQPGPFYWSPQIESGKGLLL